MRQNFPTSPRRTLECRNGHASPRRCKNDTFDTVRKRSVFEHKIEVAERRRTGMSNAQHKARSKSVTECHLSWGHWRVCRFLITREFKKTRLDFALMRTHALNPRIAVIGPPVLHNFRLRIRQSNLTRGVQTLQLHVNAVFLFALPATVTAASGSCAATSRRATRTFRQNASSLIKVKCLRAKSVNLVTSVVGQKESKGLRDSAVR
jgi:hypothetical protein